MLLFMIDVCRAVNTRMNVLLFKDVTREGEEKEWRAKRTGGRWLVRKHVSCMLLNIHSDTKWVQQKDSKSVFPRDWTFCFEWSSESLFENVEKNWEETEKLCPSFSLNGKKIIQHQNVSNVFSHYTDVSDVNKLSGTQIASLVSKKVPKLVLKV